MHMTVCFICFSLSHPSVLYHYWLPICLTTLEGLFVGGALHVDDVNNDKCSVMQQAEIVNEFAEENGLRVNPSTGLALENMGP